VQPKGDGLGEGEAVAEGVRLLNAESVRLGELLGLWEQVPLGEALLVEEALTGRLPGGHTTMASCPLPPWVT